VVVLSSENLKECDKDRWRDSDVDLNHDLLKPRVNGINGIIIGVAEF
jgi:hypothetical protein